MTNAFTITLVFLFTWWLVLFMVLPFGVKPPESPESGHSTGAPEKPDLKRKFLITTVISLILCLLFFWLTDGVLIAPDMTTD